MRRKDIQRLYKQSIKIIEWDIELPFGVDNLMEKLSMERKQECGAFAVFTFEPDPSAV